MTNPLMNEVAHKRSQKALLQGLLLSMWWWIGLTGIPSLTHAAPNSEELKILNESDHRMMAARKKIISESLDLTPEEAKGFWPVYERYLQELTTLDDRRRNILSDYGENYDNVSDEDAERFLISRMKLRQDRYRIMMEFVPKFERVLPMKKLARYYHIELKIRSFIDAGIEEELPLIR